jgi:predicted acetyltransferase
LPEAWSLGLRYVELITDPDNSPSQKVILANGGQLIGPFREHEAYGAKESLRFRINAP